MIDLTEREHEVLREAHCMGGAGLMLGNEIALSTALRLGVMGLVTITTNRPQRALITAQGKAFMQRLAFA